VRVIDTVKGDGIEETLATENYEREVLIRAPAHVHSAHAAPCCWGRLAAHPQPALRTGLMPLLGVLLFVFGE